MREEYGSLPMSIHDEGFGDIGFDADEPDFIRDDVDPNIDVSISISLFTDCVLYVFIVTSLQESLMAEELEQNDFDQRSMKDPVPSTSRSMLDLESHNLVGDDGFGSSGFGRK